jgi:hypothetical protein
MESIARKRRFEEVERKKAVEEKNLKIAKLEEEKLEMRLKLKEYEAIIKKQEDLEGKMANLAEAGREKEGESVEESTVGKEIDKV